MEHGREDAHVCWCKRKMTVEALLWIKRGEEGGRSGEGRGKIRVRYRNYYISGSNWGRQERRREKQSTRR